MKRRAKAEPDHYRGSAKTIDALMAERLARKQLSQLLCEMASDLNVHFNSRTDTCGGGWPCDVFETLQASLKKMDGIVLPTIRREKHD